MAVAITPAWEAALSGVEAALTAVVDTDSVAVSCNVNSQSQASGRSQVSSELCSSLVVNLVVGPSLGDVRSIAEHEMKVIAHHGIATNLDGEEPC